MGISSSHDEELKTKLKLTMANEADSVLDGTEVYGVAQNLFISNPLLTNIKEAIHEHLKVVFYYKSLSSAASLRIVHPYKLIHTPVSWYLLGYCEDRKNFRNFKLTRIDKFKVMNDKFHPHKFNLSELIGDSWWLRYDPEKLENPYKVKVLFTDEAALSIKEYIFHSSQKIQDHKNGTIVEWELSYLGEFASWLMQWMPDFEIESPKELKNIINQRISEYQK
jgi:proteasome accessory factor B